MTDAPGLLECRLVCISETHATVLRFFRNRAIYSLGPTGKLDATAM
jgi:hypothetical protein